MDRVNRPGDGTVTPTLIPGDIYEQLCITLYAYRFGTISFLELVKKFEELLELAESGDGLGSSKG